jgi:hypothetical protein
LIVGENRERGGSTEREVRQTSHRIPDSLRTRMKGRDHFTSAEADEVRSLLKLVRKAEPGTPQKLLRDQLRAIGFYISDFAGGPAGFTASDFDDLVARGLLRITDSPSASAKKSPRLGKSTPPQSRPVPAVRRGARAAGPETAPSLRIRDTEAAAALAALAAEPMSIKSAVHGGVPDQPGLYALHGSRAVWRELGLGVPPDGRPLYVGKAEASLVSRDLKTHFATGRTGQSSPRRSFAALLAQAGALQLVAIPRRWRNPEPTKWTHYALEEPGDGQLTAWMCGKLRIAVWPSPAGAWLAAVEREILQKWLPPLNLTGVRTPWTDRVKAARALMAAQAREWARKRGFDA